MVHKIKIKNMFRSIILVAFILTLNSLNAQLTLAELHSVVREYDAKNKIWSKYSKISAVYNYPENASKGEVELMILDLDGKQKQEITILATGDQPTCNKASYKVFVGEERELLVEGTLSPPQSHSSFLLDPSSSFLKVGGKNFADFSKYMDADGEMKMHVLFEEGSKSTGCVISIVRTLLPDN